MLFSLKGSRRGRKVRANGKASLEITIPLSVAKAAEIFLGDIVIIDTGEGFLEKQIVIKKLKKGALNNGILENR